MPQKPPPIILKLLKLSKFKPSKKSSVKSKSTSKKRISKKIKGKKRKKKISSDSESELTMEDPLDDPYGFKNMIMSKMLKVASHEDFEWAVYLAKQECRRCSFSSIYGPVLSPRPSTFHPSPRTHISPHPAFLKPLSMLQCTIPSPHPSLEKEPSSQTSTPPKHQTI